MATDGSFTIVRDSNYYYTFYWSVQSTTSTATTVYWRIKSHPTSGYACLWYLNIGLVVNTGILSSFSTNAQTIATSYNGGNGDYNGASVSYYANEASSSISNNTTATLYKAGTESSWTSGGKNRNPRNDVDVVSGIFTITHASGKAGFTISVAMNLVNTTPTYSNSSAYTLPDLGGTVKVWNGSTWANAIPYVYTGSGGINGWHQAIPYAYTGSGGTNGWQITSG